MAGEVVRIQGIDDLKNKLLALPKAMRTRVLRNALTAGARIVRDDAKQNAPVLSSANRSAPYRKPGTVRDAIRVRSSRRDRRAGDVGVFVNVKPAGAGKRGAKSKDDPFYWRWLEWGWNAARRGESKRSRRALNKSGASKRVQGRRFLTKASGKLGQALEVFQSQLGRWIDKVNTTGRVDQ